MIVEINGVSSKKGIAVLATSAAVALAIAAGLVMGQLDWTEAFPNVLDAWLPWNGATHMPLSEYASAQYTSDPSAQSGYSLNPTRIGGISNDILSQWGTRTLAAFESGGRTYVAIVSYDDDNIRIMDMTDPYNVVAAGGIADDDRLYLGGARVIATFESAGHLYAAVASGDDDGVQIIDLTDPYNVVEAGSVVDDNLYLDGAWAIDTFKSDGHTYAAITSYYSGIQIIDLTDPHNVTPAGGIADDNPYLGRADNIDMFKSDGRTYAAVASEYGPGVQIIDLTDPYNVTAAGDIADDDGLYLGSPTDVATFESYGRTYAAVTSKQDDGVQIIDLTDPYNVTAAGYIADKGRLHLSDTRGIVPFESGGRTYAAVGSYTRSGVQIIDLTDPYNVVAAGRLADNDSIYLNGAQIDTFESGGHTYVAAASYYNSGIQIIDLTDPYNVTAADGLADDNDVHLRRADGVATFESDGRTYAAITSYRDGSVQIIDLTDPHNVTPAGSITNSDGIHLRSASSIDTFESGGRTYAAATSHFDGIQILNLTDPHNVTPAGGIADIDMCDSGSRHVTVFESGGRPHAAIVSWFHTGYVVQIVNLTDPHNVTPADCIVGLGRPTGITTFELAGHTYAAITLPNSGINILDLTNPYSISEVAHITGSSGVFFYGVTGIDAFEVGGIPHLATASTRNGVQILQLATPDTGTCITDAAHATIIPPEIAASANRFAVDFYRQISGETGNVFFSPVSVYEAFSMVGEAARGETAAQLRNAFGFDPDVVSRHDDMAALASSLNRPDPCATLQTASSLWLAERFEPYDSYINVVDDVYSGHMETVYFADGGVDRINGWAAEMTNGTIPKVLDRDMVGENTAFAVLNAIYFKGSWEKRFPAANTHESDFWTGAQNVTADFMEITTDFQYVHSDGVQVLRMPYQGDRLSMLVVLPTDRDGLERLENTISPELIEGWREGQHSTLIRALVPKFEVNAHYDLVRPLMSMGVGDVFDRETSDLSGMAPLDPRDRLYVEFAMQDAYVKVNEEGTEAAAVTSGGGSGFVLSLPPQPVLFIADHPFLFLIQDDESGTVLFLGRISDPLAGG